MSLVRHFVLPFLLSLFFVFGYTSVFAQSAGVGISPATIEERADPGSVLVEEVSVTNLSETNQIYYLFTRDITGVQSGGVPVFANEGAEKTGYELTEWVTLSVDQVELEPDETQSVSVSIDVPENATPGSHFGAVFVSLEPPRMRSVGAAVGYDVANIISIRVAGDAVENAQIRSFATDNYIYGETDVNFNAVLENKGTVLVRPIGPLEIYNMFDKKVAALTFNETQAGIFPLTNRDFTINWTSEDIGFGRYQAVLSLVYGDDGRQATISSTATFWILPMNIILPALGVLAFILLAIYISFKLYVRRTLRRVGGVRRRVAQKSGQGSSLLLLVTIVMLAVTALFLIILLALFA